jgi:parallel beta-helix repeat protein
MALRYTILAGVLAALPMMVTPAFSQELKQHSEHIGSQTNIECGDTLGPRGTFVLHRDLDCDSVAHPVALTLLDGAKLSMRGHTISCSAAPAVDSTGIQLPGDGSILENGSVVGCNIGVHLAGNGRHVVKRMSLLECGGNSFHVESSANNLFDNFVTGGDFAFGIFGDNNLIIHNHSIESTGTGFHVLGANNRLYRNRSDRSVCHGFSVDGPSNRLHRNEATGNVLRNCPAINVPGGSSVLHDNIATGNSGDGFFVYLRDLNRLFGNTADGNRGTGIHIATTSKNNLLLRNAAVGNAIFDLQDDNPQCDGNTWKKNEHETSNVACIR